MRVKQNKVVTAFHWMSVVMKWSVRVQTITHNECMKLHSIDLSSFDVDGGVARISVWEYNYQLYPNFTCTKSSFNQTLQFRATAEIDCRPILSICLNI